VIWNPRLSVAVAAGRPDVLLCAMRHGVPCGSDFAPPPECQMNASMFCLRNAVSQHTATSPHAYLRSYAYMALKPSPNATESTRVVIAK
jgi:hypothetical protein